MKKARGGRPAPRQDADDGAYPVPTRLSACGVSRGIFPVLAEEAAQQWTARFNPRPVGEGDILGLFDAALT